MLTPIVLQLLQWLTLSPRGLDGAKEQQLSRNFLQTRSHSKDYLTVTSNGCISFLLYADRRIKTITFLTHAALSPQWKELINRVLQINHLSLSLVVLDTQQTKCYYFVLHLIIILSTEQSENNLVFYEVMRHVCCWKYLDKILLSVRMIVNIGEY